MRYRKKKSFVERMESITAKRARLKENANKKEYRDQRKDTGSHTFGSRCMYDKIQENAKVQVSDIKAKKK